VTVDVSPWEENARALEWLETPSGLLYPRNAARKVVNGSHSTFETASRCGLRAWFDKVACVPRTPKEAPDRGVRIHALCEHYGKHGEFPGDDFTVELKNAQGEKIQVKPTKLDRLCAEAAEPFIPLVDGVTHEEGVFLNPSSKREGVFKDGKGATLGFSGKIDVFDPRGVLYDSGYFDSFQGASALEGLPPGTPSTPDYKTRSSFNYAPGVGQLCYDTQQARYAVAGLLASPRSPYFGSERVPEKVIVAHVNIGTKTIQTLPIADVMTRDTIERVWEKTQQDAIYLLDLCRVEKVADVPYNKGACGDFRGCDHAAICPRSPQNSNPRGRLGTLFGGTERNTGTAGKDSDMAKINFKSLKSKSNTTSKKESPPAEKVKKPAPSFKRFAKSRTQTPDAGVVRENTRKSDELGAPLATPALVQRAVRVARAAAKGAGAKVDERTVRLACAEVGIDFELVAKELSDLLEGTVFVSDTPETSMVEVDTPAPAEVPLMGAGDPAKKAANTAAYEYLLQCGGEATLGKVRERARVAYNEVEQDKPINRWTHVADDRVFDADIFSREGKAATDTIRIAVPQEAQEAPQEVQEAPQSPQEAPQSPQEALIDVAQQALSQNAPITLSLGGDAVVVLPQGLYEGGVSSDTPQTKVPVIYVDCFPVEESYTEFDAWLAPYCKMVETDESVHYWRAMAYNAGAGQVASRVSRHIAQAGTEVLPVALRVNSSHPAWGDVRSVLYGLPAGSVRMIESTRR